MDGKFSWLECLTRVQWSLVQIPVSLTFYNYFRESVSGEDHTYHLIQQHSCDSLLKTLVEEMW